MSAGGRSAPVAPACQVQFELLAQAKKIREKPYGKLKPEARWSSSRHHSTGPVAAATSSEALAWKDSQPLRVFGQLFRFLVESRRLKSDCAAQRTRRLPLRAYEC